MNSGELSGVTMKILLIFALCISSFQCEKNSSNNLFPGMPDNIRIVYVDPKTTIKMDNKKEVMMGVSDAHCDNGRVKNTKPQIF